MINRGPDSVRVLKLWARNEEAHGVDHVDRPMGNHEIMMMLAAIGGPHARKAETMWLSRRMGGHVLLDQMAAGAGHPTAHDGGALGLDQPWLPDWKGGFGGTLVVHGHPLARQAPFAQWFRRPAPVRGRPARSRRWQRPHRHRNGSGDPGRPLSTSQGGHAFRESPPLRGVSYACRLVDRAPVSSSRLRRNDGGERFDVRLSARPRCPG